MKRIETYKSFIVTPYVATASIRLSAGTTTVDRISEGQECIFQGLRSDAGIVVENILGL